MSPSLVICTRVTEKRQPLECMCVECGAVRPTFRIPRSYIAKGLLPMLMMGFSLHEEKQGPSIIYMPLEVDAGLGIMSDFDWAHPNKPVEPGVGLESENL